MTKSDEYSHWYTHSRWRRRRAQFLDKYPLCVFCEREGRVELATVVDHKVPHRGDLELFWDWDNYQSLCKFHHDSTKKVIEAGKKLRWTIGLDGWPVMPSGGIPAVDETKA
ncbi:5-methylcytosine-specific restriction endonuclease McrA [Variovorax paradoxus]|uniref:HNH endonuclease n=1 Tax=Variovorax paradoxus TaxID=34073 RepID=UPI0027888912|nr:HNH endonuclease [Variovorax paradoxus]MDQ0027745.1 5-methylcytosine-specific restriction endonuclease McrA [Variovorax paradoxus]